MKYSSDRPKFELQQQTYSELELLPMDVLLEKRPRLHFRLGLRWCWRHLLNLLLAELVLEERQEYLDHCWQQQPNSFNQATQTQFWRRFFWLIR